MSVASQGWLRGLSGTAAPSCASLWASLSWVPVELWVQVGSRGWLCGPLGIVAVGGEILQQAPHIGRTLLWVGDYVKAPAWAWALQLSPSRQLCRADRVETLCCGAAAWREAVFMASSTTQLAAPPGSQACRSAKLSRPALHPSRWRPRL